MKSRLKVILTVSLMLFGNLSFGSEIWRAVRWCDSNAAVVDHNEGPCNSDRCPAGGTALDYQLVIRDMNIIHYLNKVGAWRSSFGDREIIIQGWKWRHPPSTPDNIRFRKIIDCPAPYNDCRWVDVRDEGRGVKVQFIHQATFCVGTLDPLQGCLGCWERQEREIANWFFRECGR